MGEAYLQHLSLPKFLPFDPIQGQHGLLRLKGFVIATSDNAIRRNDLVSRVKRHSSSPRQAVRHSFVATVYAALMSIHTSLIRS